MITIESLRAYGADVNDGLARCMNNESFYLRMVNMVLSDASNFDKLKAAAQAGDAKAAFEAAHALKGATGNVSLTPIYKPICEFSDTLKGHTDQPIPPQCLPLVDEAIKQYDAARNL